MINRKEAVLKELIIEKDYITSGYLSKKLGVSPRTIRQDIRRLSVELKEVGVILQATPSKGYLLNKNDREKSIAYFDSVFQTKADIPNWPTERIQFIIRLLLFGNEIIDLDVLTGKLCVSRSTIEKDIQRVKEWFSNQGLELLYKKDRGFFIKGNEASIRYAMVNYFAGSDFFPSLPKLTELSAILGETYIKPITQILSKIHKTEKISLSDADFLNLTIYLTASIMRIEKQEEIKLVEPEFRLLEMKKEYTLALNIVQQIKQKFSIKFPKAELFQLTKYLMHINIVNSTNQDFPNSEEKDLSRFIKKVIEKINTHYYLDFSKDQELIISLSHYLNSLISSKQYKTLVKNPSLAEIATQYPNALEIAVTISNMLREEYGIEID